MSAPDSGHGNKKINQSRGDVCWNVTGDIYPVCNGKDTVADVSFFQVSGASWGIGTAMCAEE